MESELSEQAGRGDPGVALDRHLGPGPRLAEPIDVPRPVLGERLAGLLGAVERLATQRQDVLVVGFEQVGSMDVAPPRPHAGRQVRRCSPRGTIGLPNLDRTIGPASARLRRRSLVCRPARGEYEAGDLPLSALPRAVAGAGGAPACPSRGRSGWAPARAYVVCDARTACRAPAAARGGRAAPTRLVVAASAARDGLSAIGGVMRHRDRRLRSCSARDALAPASV
jgi:hypothetical protein